MRALQRRYPQIEFDGIGGPRMLSVGMRSRAPMETLSVMGLVEVLRHLPGLLRLRRELRRVWRQDPPDLFIGVDAPDFNLGLERSLRLAGVPTVHYVSPTVWAWREGRVKTIRRSVDLLLSIFPFEPAFLEKHGIASAYVGHTLAAEMPQAPDRSGAREALGLQLDQPVLALLPGSRAGEVTRLARPFLLAAQACCRQNPGIRLVAPLVNERIARLWHEEKARYAPDLPVIEVMQESRRVLAAADVVLTASGTATFEGLLSKRPMVVGYKLNALTYWLARLFRLVKLDHVAMANLLAGETLAPEFIQHACEAENLAPAVMAFFNDPVGVAKIQDRYRQLHRELATDTGALAADAVMRLLRDREVVEAAQDSEGGNPR